MENKKIVIMDGTLNFELVEGTSKNNLPYTAIFIPISETIKKAIFLRPAEKELFLNTYK